MVSDKGADHIGINTQKISMIFLAQHINMVHLKFADKNKRGSFHYIAFGVDLKLKLSLFYEKYLITVMRM
jgi:hypothetical protein